MNYYPTNFYSSYPQYQNGYNPMPMQNTLPSAQMQPTQTNSNIPGKIVDSYEVAKVSDIPFGGYGIFPKADLSEVYIKMWNNNGTTSVVTCKPIIESEVMKESKENNGDLNYQLLLDKIESLEKKINELNKTGNGNSNKRKELNASAY